MPISIQLFIIINILALFIGIEIGRKLERRERIRQTSRWTK